jgi:hypothetical protein
MSPIFIKFIKAALFPASPISAASFHYFRRFQMYTAKINTIPGFIAYVRENSTSLLSGLIIATPPEGVEAKRF